MLEPSKSDEENGRILEHGCGPATEFHVDLQTFELDLRKAIERVEKPRPLLAPDHTSERARRLPKGHRKTTEGMAADSVFSGRALNKTAT
jgi:hypothetical protein